MVTLVLCIIIILPCDKKLKRYSPALALQKLFAILNICTLSERKVLWLTGFYLNVGKTFADLASFVLKVLKKQLLKNSSGKLSRFVRNLRKPQIFAIYGKSQFFVVMARTWYNSIMGKMN